MPSVATGLPPLSSSSQVMNSAEFWFWYAGEARIGGTACDSHWSPVLIEQSWVSLHMFGVIHTKLGVVASEARSELRSAYGTTLAASVGLLRTSSKQDRGRGSAVTG